MDAEDLVCFWHFSTKTDRQTEHKVKTTLVTAWYSWNNFTLAIGESKTKRYGGCFCLVIPWRIEYLFLLSSTQQRFYDYLCAWSIKRWMTLRHYVTRTVVMVFSFSLVAKSFPTLVTPWTVACQALLSMGFSKEEYQSGLAYASPGYRIRQTFFIWNLV